ncbi:hypothetical protein N7533_012764 [Penicillium manginii]|uniref:uncharacterized protein n=1 Tax=Penicillium manginii TaxID=203109 RepID=UPI0025478256|nr:uncharacterized protein N7533_012764 [Penicillium manginii]KAJ5739980.1 hypothetical protein N7533_012764 [Penicillium manginii]
MAMRIDNLLNPDSGSGSGEYSAHSSPYTHHATVPPSSHGTSYAQPSPGYPPSPNQYWYNRYQGYHDTSPGAASTATTHSSVSGGAVNAQQQHMFFPYKPSGISSFGGSQSGSTSLSLSGRTGSAPSSPDPFHPRERYDSVSSSSSTNGPADRRRPPRPKYEEEEMYFIWYHRVDLCQEWKEVRESFNHQFPSRQRRGFQGIQCKFYRFIKEKKCPTLREQRRMRDGEFLREGAALGPEAGAPRFGVIEWANVWYPWMREDRETALRRQRAAAAAMAAEA